MKRCFFFLLYLLIPTMVLADEANKPSIVFVTKDNTVSTEIFKSLVGKSNYLSTFKTGCSLSEIKPNKSYVIFVDSESCGELLYDEIKKHHDENDFLLVSYSTATSAKEIEKIPDYDAKKALIIKSNASSSSFLEQKIKEILKERNYLSDTNTEKQVKSTVFIYQATSILLDILKQPISQPDRLQKEADKFRIIRPEKAPLRTKAGVSDTTSCEKDYILQQGEIVKVDNSKLSQGNYIYVKSFLSAPTTQGKEGWIHRSLVEKLESK